MKKFDVIISNPPYQDGKHMTFLNTAYTFLNDTGTMLFLQPSTYFVSLLGPLLKRSNRIKFPEKEIKSIELLTNKTFGEFADLYVPLSITKIQRGTDNKNIINVKYEGGNDFEKIDTLSKVNVFGNIPAVFSIIEKFKNKDNILNHVIKEKSRFEWFVELAIIIGDRDINNIAVSKSLVPTQSPKFHNRQTIGFNSEKEAISFISFMRTDFSRKLLELLKLSQNLHRGELSLIPWVDFSKDWDNEKLFDFFDLSQDERLFINTTKKYY